MEFRNSRQRRNDDFIKKTDDAASNKSLSCDEKQRMTTLTIAHKREHISYRLFQQRTFHSAACVRMKLYLALN